MLSEHHIYVTVLGAFISAGFVLTAVLFSMVFCAWNMGCSLGCRSHSGYYRTEVNTGHEGHFKDSKIFVFI